MVYVCPFIVVAPSFGNQRKEEKRIVFTNLEKYLYVTTQSFNPEIPVLELPKNRDVP